MLIDAGISLKDLARRLASVGADVEELDALIVSHEHGDHVRGAITVSRRKSIPVYASPATARESGLLMALPREMVFDFAADEPFLIGAIEVAPFALPHDAIETFGFKLSDGRIRAGIATDLGSLTLDVVQGLAGCDVVVLESNHDEVMLLEGPYPAFLKKRVNSPHGHLSNADAAELVRCIRHSGMRHLVLAHLSRTNNIPDLPLETARKALGTKGARVEVSLGWQDRPGELIRIR